MIRIFSGFGIFAILIFIAEKYPYFEKLCAFLMLIAIVLIVSGIEAIVYKYENRNRTRVIGMRHIQADYRNVKPTPWYSTSNTQGGVKNAK